MKLDKLRTLRDELSKEFDVELIKARIFYFFGSKWNLLDESLALHDPVVQCLDRAKAESIAYHESSSRSAYFRCDSIDCTVALEYPSSPQLATRKRSKNQISEVLERASNAYKVAHNPLTFLLARDAFRSALRVAIESVDAVVRKDAQAKASGDHERIVALFALDIDHFKQVNDSHGHLYGDQVLKTFAIRLESAAEQVRALCKQPVDLVIGHPSGEEFLALFAGSVTREQLLEFGSLFRKTIGGEPLPSDAEWGRLRERDNLTLLVPPPMHERNVTASIGLAFYQPKIADEPLDGRISRLLDQADTALYRAKSAGRNTVIPFDDILNSCGRVLEHDKNTRIVAIDVGKNVGVTTGQEFKVFPPGFTGKRKFLINDGRTTRTIGLYPRFDITRVTVFDVQPELSFAFISNSSEASVEIEVGSHLEAIAIGSIGHLLPHGAKYFARSMEGTKVGDISTVQEFIKLNSASSPKPFAVVLRFSRSDQYLKRYGPAPLNTALARLYRAAAGAFHTAVATGILDSESICIVGKGAVYNEKKLSEFVEELATEFPELGLVAGVFCHDDLDNKPSAGKARLDPRHAIEFAGFAASDHAINSESRVTHFDYSVAAKILVSLRESQSWMQARADFEKLSSLGVESPVLLNLGGLVFSAIDENSRAAELMEKAAELGESPIFKSNFGTVAYELGEVDRGLRILSKLTDLEVQNLETSHPFGYVTYARLLAHARINKSQANDEARFHQIARTALNLAEFKDDSQSQIIKDALEMDGRV